MLVVRERSSKREGGTAAPRWVRSKGGNISRELSRYILIISRELGGYLSGYLGGTIGQSMLILERVSITVQGCPAPGAPELLCDERGVWLQCEQRAFKSGVSDGGEDLLGEISPLRA